MTITYKKPLQFNYFDFKRFFMYIKIDYGILALSH